MQETWVQSLDWKIPWPQLLAALPSADQMGVGDREERSEVSGALPRLLAAHLGRQE